jgi:PAS domain S-box-containing protein
MGDLSRYAVSDVVAFIGTIVQTSVAVLLAGLFFLLSRRAGRRPYTVAWSWALVALAAGIAAVVASYILPATGTTLGSVDRITPALLVLNAAYLFCKLLFSALLVSGALEFVGQPVHRGVQVGAAIALATFAMATAGLLGTIDKVVAVQAALLAPSIAACGVVLTRLPPERRGVGSRLTITVCMATALLWLVYGAGYGLNWLHLAEQGYVNPLWPLLRANPFIDTVMEMLLAFGLVVMINEQAEREVEEERAGRLRELATSGERLSAVIRGAMDAIVLLDGKGMITLSNAAADQMFAPAGDTVAGRPFARCVAEGERAPLAAWLTTAQAAEVPNRAMLGLRHDGSTFRVEASSADLSLGGATHRLLVIRDITGRERAESERMELQQRLAQFEKTEALGRLVSGITHELNNPLAAILAAVGDLLEQEPTGHKRQVLAVIHEQAQRCRLITRNLVYFIRGGEGQRQETAPTAIVARAVEEVRQEAERQQVTLTLVTPPQMPSLMADPVALEQVVANLTLNAIEAAGSGGRVRVVLSVGDGRLVLAVEDNGPGIPPLLLSRIFDPFFTRKPVGRGSGLGLPVALGIIQHHGGTLVAENIAPPGRGARVTAEIPLSPGKQRSHQMEERPLSASQRRALIIDDEAPVRSPLRRFLERRGWQVVEAEDGGQGLQILRRSGFEDFDLILSDLKMPGMSGIELHEQLQAERADLVSRLVFITGDVVSTDVAAFLRQTARPVLEKPFELTELDSVIERLSAPRQETAPDLP